jgi:mannose-6-phosphate isomerase-like protein (cupin superfamily)
MLINRREVSDNGRRDRGRFNIFVAWGAKQPAKSCGAFYGSCRGGSPWRSVGCSRRKSLFHQGFRGLGPELHIHPEQNELFYLLKGSIGLQCGSERTILKAGDSFMAPLNVPHAYVTLGAEPAHMLNVFDPAGRTEAFFADYAPLVNVAGEPDRNKLAAVYAKHGLKVVGPPLKASSFSS